MELIKITTDEFTGKTAVSARSLYEFLGVKERFSRFMERNIEFGFIAGTDYTPYQTVHPSNKQPFEDYALSLDCAKEISMLQRTDKGKEARIYFIECEKKAQLFTNQVPTTFAHALRLAADLQEANEAQAKQLAEAKPKVDFFDQVADSKDAIDIGSAARVLNAGIGRNRLFEILRNKGVLMQNNTPYQKYIDMGWFRVIEQKYNKPDGTNCINIKTLVYQKGLQGILKIIK